MIDVFLGSRCSTARRTSFGLPARRADRRARVRGASSPACSGSAGSRTSTGPGSARPPAPTTPIAGTHRRASPSSWSSPGESRSPGGTGTVAGVHVDADPLRVRSARPSVSRGSSLTGRVRDRPPGRSPPVRVARSAEARRSAARALDGSGTPGRHPGATSLAQHPRVPAGVLGVDLWLIRAIRASVNQCACVWHGVAYFVSSSSGPSSSPPIASRSPSSSRRPVDAQQRQVLAVRRPGTTGGRRHGRARSPPAGRGRPRRSRRRGDAVSWCPSPSRPSRRIRAPSTGGFGHAAAVEVHRHHEPLAARAPATAGRAGRGS